MAISRPLLFALIGALALFAVVMGMRLMGAVGRRSRRTRPRPARRQPPPPPGRAPQRRPPRARRVPPAGRGEARRGASQGPRAPETVLRALLQRKVVVPFFGQYRSADDRATRRAVRAAGRKRGVAVFADSINDVPDYPRVTSGLGIQQSRSTAVIDRHGRARVTRDFSTRLAEPARRRCSFLKASGAPINLRLPVTPLRSRVPA